MKRSPAKVKRILDRCDGVCRYCGIGLDLKTVRLDHIIAQARGGNSKDENLAASCARCNTLKWDYPLETFLDRIQSKWGKAVDDAEYYADILRRAGRLEP
jgi:5-methylcytosine-specific restriction endonuclease McrA